MDWLEENAVGIVGIAFLILWVLAIIALLKYIL